VAGVWSLSASESAEGVITQSRPAPLRGGANLRAGGYIHIS